MPPVHDHSRGVYDGHLNPTFVVKREADIPRLRDAIELLNKYAKAAIAPTTDYKGVEVRVSNGHHGIDIAPEQGTLDLLVRSDGNDGKAPLPLFVSWKEGEMRVTIGDTSYIIHTR